MAVKAVSASSVVASGLVVLFRLGCLFFMRASVNVSHAILKRKACFYLCVWVCVSVFRCRGNPGTGVTGICQSLDVGCWEQNSDPLGEQ